MATSPGRTPGLLTGIFGCVFGVLGILTIGIIFVPLAALCTVSAFFRGLLGLSGTSIGVAALSGVLTAIGFAVSPSLWLVAGGIIAASVAPHRTADMELAVADCTREEGDIRKIVCSDEMLSKWSIRMFRAYDHKYDQATDKMKKWVTKSQEDWLKSRAQTCDLMSPRAVTCLLDETRDRAILLERPGTI